MSAAAGPQQSVTVGSDQRLRWVVGLIAAGVLLPVTISGWLLGGIFSLFITAPAIAALVTALRTSGVVSITLGPEGAAVELADGSGRFVPRSEVGGIAVRGWQVNGVTLDAPGWWNSGSPSAVVVLDRFGRVVSAQRGGWFRTPQLARAARQAGYQWYGQVDFAAVSLAPVAWPAGVMPPGGARGLDDRATVETVARMRRRSRWQVIGAWLALLRCGRPASCSGCCPRTAPAPTPWALSWR